MQIFAHLTLLAHQEKGDVSNKKGCIPLKKNLFSSFLRYKKKSIRNDNGKEIFNHLQSPLLTIFYPPCAIKGSEHCFLSKYRGKVMLLTHGYLAHMN